MKLIKTLIVLAFSLASISSWSMDPKLKIVAESAGYGVVSGTLLGAATLAFGGGGRNIAKGASIGLYAGLVFGAYVITSYEMKKRGWGQETDTEYYPDEEPGARLHFSETSELYAISRKEKEQPEAVLLSFPVLNFTF